MRDRKDLTVTQWNARGLNKTRLVEFIQYLSIHNPQLVLLSETHWSPLTTPKFKTYFSFNTYRPDNAAHGGVAILVHKSLSCSQISVPSFPSLEVTGISLYLNGVPHDFYSVYCPNGRACASEAIDNFFQFASQRSAHFFIGGDFNAHSLLWDNRFPINRCGRAIESILENFSQIALLTAPNTVTRQVVDSESTIDLTFASVYMPIVDSPQPGSYLGSDHLPISTTIRIAPLTSTSAPKWRFNNGYWDIWNDLIFDKLSSNNFLNITDPDLLYQYFVSALMFTSRSLFFLSTGCSLHKREPHKPWFNSDCKKVITDEH